MRQKVTIRFFLTSIATAILGCILIFILQYHNFFQHIITFSWLSLAFFLLITILSFQINALTLRKNLKHRFMQIFLATLVGKLLLSLALILTYALITRPSSFTFVIPFFVFFLVYKTIEITYILKLTKGDTSSSSSG